LLAMSSACGRNSGRDSGVAGNLEETGAPSAEAPASVGSIADVEEEDDWENYSAEFAGDEEESDGEDGEASGLNGESCDDCDENDEASGEGPDYSENGETSEDPAPSENDDDSEDTSAEAGLGPFERYMEAMEFLTEYIFAVDADLTLGLGMRFLGIPMLSLTFDGNLKLIEDGDETRVFMTLDLGTLAAELLPFFGEDFGVIETYAVFRGGSLTYMRVNESGQVSVFEGGTALDDIGIPVSLDALFFVPVIEQADILSEEVTYSPTQTTITLTLGGDGITGSAVIDDMLLGMLPGDILGLTGGGGIGVTLDSLVMQLATDPAGIPRWKSVTARVTMLVEGLLMNVDVSVRYTFNAFDTAVSIAF